MTNTEKAERILESLDEVFNVNWNFKKEYIDAITKALGDMPFKTEWSLCRASCLKPQGKIHR